MPRLKKSLLAISYSIIFVLAGLFTSPQASAQSVVSWLPYFATVEDSISITYDATQGNGALSGLDTVFIHVGLVTSSSTGTGWTNVQGNWGTRDLRVRMRPLGNNLHFFKVKIRTFFNYPTGAAFRLGMVFRNRDGSRVGRSSTGGDIFLPLYQPNQPAARIISPQSNLLIVEQGVPITVEGRTSVSGNLRLLDGANVVASASGSVINAAVPLNTLGYTWLKLQGDQGGAVNMRDSIRVFVRKAATVAPLPPGIQPGINYQSNGTTVFLALVAPLKQFTFLLGDFNNFELDNNYLMNRTPDGTTYWLQVDNLPLGGQVAFQYFVDGQVRIGDPYCDEVLDPNNDQFIPRSTYPGLRTYPARAQGIVSLMFPGQQPYQWRNPNFVKPAKKDLVIYELWVHDFTNDRNFQRLTDSLSYLKRLGVNAIEIMPVNEFDGNISWGYNPSYHHAIDKAYGGRNGFKAFVDACHGMGIAVIVDMVFNHGTGNSPYAALYWNSGENKPAANSPFFNTDARHPFNVYNDMNHESQYVQYYMDRVNKQFLTEYKVDGFRFDLSKGFTQVNSGSNVGFWSQYDASRVRLLKRMADEIWRTVPDAVVMLEHLADNSEERELANYGMMLWGNMNYNYREAVSGDTPNSDIAWGYYRNRNWNDPHLVSYMESHDEERLIYWSRTEGVTFNPNHNPRNLDIALHRSKLAATFFFTIPGPKMIWQFGELGYDFSINHCPNGTVNGNCRTDSKPIRWDYYQDANRNNLWKAYQALIRLKLEEPIFSSPTANLNVGGTSYKFIKNSLNGDHVVVVGNFAVSNNNIIPGFQTTGKYYEFFTGDSITVTNTNMVLAMAPSEFRIYSTKKFFTPDRSILLALDPEQGVVGGASETLVYPNPSAGTFKIRTNLTREADVRYTVYDMMGKEVFSQQVANQPVGTFVTEWNGNNYTGQRLAPGTYMVKVQAGKAVDMVRVVVQ